MKNWIITFSFLLLSLTAFCQDVILLQTGEEIKVKVTEILPLDIKYKRFDHQEGPTITLSKKEVFMIKYENGRKEVFGITQASESTKPETTYQPIAQKPTPVTSRKRDFPTEEQSLFVGLAMPVENFGRLKPGFHVGIENVNNRTPYFGFIGQLLGSYNKANADYGYYYYDGSGGIINLYGLTGVRINTPGENFRVFGTATVGADWIILVGDFSDFDSGLKLATGLGAGFIIKNIVEFGGRFNYSVGAEYPALYLTAGMHF